MAELSPIQADDLGMQFLPKGSVVWCAKCVRMWWTGVGMMVAPGEMFLCPKDKGCRA